MGLMKRFLEDVSEKMGLEGLITPEVISEGTLIIDGKKKMDAVKKLPQHQIDSIWKSFEQNASSVCISCNKI